MEIKCGVLNYSEGQSKIVLTDFVLRYNQDTLYNED